MRWSQPICEEIFRKKYMIHGEESPEEVLENVANAISSVEKNDKERSKWKKIFHDLLSSGKFLPAGRILSNARLQDKGIRNLNNCFTIEITDSMGGIFDALKEDALIQRQGGGVGFDLSPLRPKGANISKGGQSSGSISFLKIFNESAKSIHTGGDRRGAHIALMDISHPDIEEFITAKRGEENNALTQFNISVKVTDEFMDKVSKDEDWDLVFDGVVYKTVKAKYLFDLLCKNAFTYNEPGLFFVDTINKYNNAPSEYTINACNPCFSGDTLITTRKGLYPIKDLVGKEVEIFDSKNWIKVNTFAKMGENQNLYRVTLGNGVYYDCTANHNWPLADGQKKRTDELVAGDKLETLKDDFEFDAFGDVESRAAYLKGFLLAEGCSTNNNRPILHIYEPKKMCFDKIKVDLETLKFENYNTLSLEKVELVKLTDLNKYNVTGLSGRSKIEQLHLWASDYKIKLPLEIFTWNKKSICEFIAGLFDGDGTVCTSINNGGSIQFTSINKEFCLDIMRLLGMLGIRSTLNLSHHKKMKEIKGKSYLCQDAWRIVIPMTDSNKLNAMCDFQRLKVDFKPKYSPKLVRHYTVKTIEKLEGLHDVYCCQVPTTNKFLINIKNINFNCGEQPLAPYQACCLGALNLSKFLTINEEQKSFSFDWNNYKQAIEISVRFLDNVLSFTDYPLDKNREMAIKYRRIGLGFTALADTLSLLGYSYDSDMGLEFCETLAKTLRDVSYEASINLAKEKGCPSGCKPKYLKNSEFIKMLDKDQQLRVLKYGLRNVALNTIAPTGTISFSLGQNCSSGIEPIFSLSYKRTIRTGNATGEDTKTEIVWDNGWLTYVDLHKEENESLEEASSRLQNMLSKDKNNPFKTTFDILPEAHLKMQGMWQQYIDSSISKTMNLPNNFKVEDYGDLIFKAHKAELKGFTTFNPNGAMKGILVADTKEESVSTRIEGQEKDSKEEIPLSRRDAPKRLVELPCDIHTMHYRGEQYLVLVGKLSGSLYEVFATLLTDELAEKIKSYQTGFIFKHGKGQYSLYITDVENNERKQLIKNIGRVFNSTFETIARMVSMSLRHGTPLQFIVDQLGKGKDIQGFERCLARVIKKYIKDGEKSVALCETCKVQLEYREGCLTCPTCGSSKCG